MTGSPSINLTAARGAMARRRDGSNRWPLWCGLAGLSVTLILAASIQVAGAATNCRQDIQALQRRCDELEARAALLSVHWNTESSRQVIMRRAQQELQLVCPDEPALLLVAAPADGQADQRSVLALDLSAYRVPAAVAGDRP